MDELLTKWNIIASGEGANRIAFLYYAKFHNPAIEDRVLLLNTSVADVKPEKTFEYLFSKDEKFKEIFEKIRREKICIFGKSPSGAGNNWKVGENEAREDFDTIRRYVTSLKVGGRDVILGITTLGGGTGNGSLPYIINKLRYNREMFFGAENCYIALGIFPYDFEASQRHFNAICGLSRLLKIKNGVQNADLVLLVDNNQIENIFGVRKAAKEERYYQINQEIIKAIDMMVAPSRKTAKSTIDIADYYQLPSNIGVYHFTPCLSLDNDPEIIEVETALEIATHNPMVPIDPKTATMAYVIVVAPSEYVETGELTQEGLEDITREWAVKNIAGKRGGILRYSSLVASEKATTLDVMILLGGFSLKDIVAKSLQKYYDFKESLRGLNDEIEIKDSEDPRVKIKINMEDMEAIETNLRSYIALTEKRIEGIKGEDIDLQKKMKEWGF